MKEEYLQASDIQFEEDFTKEGVERYFSGINRIKAGFLARFCKNSRFLRDYVEDRTTYLLYQRIKLGLSEDSIHNLTFLYPSRLAFETIDDNRDVHSHVLNLERFCGKDNDILRNVDVLPEDTKYFYNIDTENFCLRLHYVKRGGRRVFVEATVPYFIKGKNIFFTDTNISRDSMGLDKLNSLRLPEKYRKYIKYFYERLGINYNRASDDYKHGIIKKVVGPDGLDYLLYGKGQTYATMQLDTLEISEDMIISED